MQKLTRIIAGAMLLIVIPGCGDSPSELEDSAARSATGLAVQPIIEPDTVIPPPPSPVAALATETGEATFYADTFDRQRTASGELLDQNDMVAAHRQLPFGTVVRVTNLRTDKSVEVRIIDRGPFGAPRVAAQKVIDLSRKAATDLGIIRQGRAAVRVEVLSYPDGRTES